MDHEPSLTTSWQIWVGDRDVSIMYSSRTTEEHICSFAVYQNYLSNFIEWRSLGPIDYFNQQVHEGRQVVWKSTIRSASSFWCIRHSNNPVSVNGRDTSHGQALYRSDAQEIAAKKALDVLTWSNWLAMWACPLTDVSLYLTTAFSVCKYLLNRSLLWNPLIENVILWLRTSIL